MAAAAVHLMVLATVLDNEPVTGYAVRKRLIAQGVQAWGGVSVASIYSVLATLAKRGLLEEIPDPTGVRTETRAYRSTAIGRRDFVTLWDQAVRTVEPAKPLAFHVAITLTGLVPRATYVQALQARRAQLDAQLATPSPRVPSQVLLPLELWRELAETERAWLERAIEVAQDSGNPLGFPNL